MLYNQVFMNCLEFFKNDKDYEYLNFVYDLLLKSKKTKDQLMPEVLTNFLLESFSKKSVPFNVIANSKKLLEFFDVFKSHSFVESIELVNQKEKLKEQVSSLGFFNKETLNEIDNLFSKIMIDSFHQFSKLNVKMFKLNDVKKELNVSKKVHNEYKKYADDQEIITTFSEKDNGFYLVKKHIPDFMVLCRYCHAIVSKTDNHIMILDIYSEKLLANVLSGTKKYNFKDFIFHDFDVLNTKSSDSKELTTVKLKDTIFNLKDYNLLVLLNLIFIIDNQYENILNSASLINNYKVSNNNNFPVLLNSFEIKDISLEDVSFDTKFNHLNNIECFFYKYLKEVENLVNFKPNDYEKDHIYMFYRFNKIEDIKKGYNDLPIIKRDYNHAHNYGLIPDLVPLQQLGSLNELDYNYYLIKYGQYNKVSILQNYNEFHTNNHLSGFYDYIQKLFSDNIALFLDNLSLLEENKVIGVSQKEFRELGNKVLLSNTPDFINNKRIKALNKNVYANEFHVYSLTEKFLDFVEKTFDVPNEYKVFFMSYRSNKQLKDLGVKGVFQSNFNFETDDVTELCYLKTFNFDILVPWKN